MTKPRTPYVETEALLAVMENRGADALALLDDMLPNELRTFDQQVDRLSEMIHLVKRQKRT
jgi:hypothetical protein